MATRKKSVGYTKDVGFQVGVRKTFKLTSDKAWGFLFSQRGLCVWLGGVNKDKLLKSEYIVNAHGDEMMLRVFEEGSHVRLNWKHPHWDNLSTLQVRVIPAKKKTTIRFHQEKLKDAEQRKEMKAHWKKVLEQIEKNVNELS
jgi:hypothetical protein